MLFGLVRPLVVPEQLLSELPQLLLGMVQLLVQLARYSCRKWYSKEDAALYLSRQQWCQCRQRL